MNKKNKIKNTDPHASSRKKDHIDLAFESILNGKGLDGRFYYEPMLSAHPVDNSDQGFSFMGASFSAPLWVSSMTGGTSLAGKINRNLARACGQYGLGMGLGSCRSLLYSDEYLRDFQVRKFIGAQPLYANLGIAQIEQLISDRKTHLIEELLGKTEADGLIVHVNPLQEWLQPEGDRISIPPKDTLDRLLDTLEAKIIVKEVGQGFGMTSLASLMKMPFEAIEFAAHGGTNFTMIELLRNDSIKRSDFMGLTRLGHSAYEMVEMVNALLSDTTQEWNCKQFIISGGIKSFLDGYYLMEKIQAPAIYGQASGFLKHAKESYESLSVFIENQIQGLHLAKSFLKIKSERNV